MANEQGSVPGTTSAVSPDDRFRTLVELAPHAMVIVDSDGKIVLVNAQVLRWFGYQREELLGQGVEVLIPERFRARHPDFRRSYAAAPTVRPMGTGRNLFGRRKDGSEFPVDISLSAMTSSNGQQVIASIADMTDRKRAEEALQATNNALALLNRELEATRIRLEAEMAGRQRTEQRFTQVFELAPHAMVIVDRLGTIQSVNTQLLHWFGYAPGELTGHPIETLIPERFRPHHPGLRNGYTQAPSIRPMGTGRALFGRRKDGSEFPVDISLSPLETPEGRQTLASIADMTDRAKGEDALRRSNEAMELINKELETFAYSVSHDLRQPVRALTSFTQILLEDYAPRLDDQGRDYLGRIQRAGERMGQMIEALLGLSRISRGELNREAVDMSALAAEVIEELAQAQPGTRPAVQIAQGLIAHADPRLLRIVLQNLLANAWKFGARSKSPNIEFGQQAMEDMMPFFVRDNGAGFEMAYADKLFGVFQRLHRADEFPGTGIGLATAHRIILRHGGRIWAEAKVGQGATFYFTL